MNQQTQDDGLDRSAEVVLAEVRESALSVDEVLAAVRHPRAGGIASFIGVVREHDHGEARGRPRLLRAPHRRRTSLRAVAEEVADRSAVIAIAAVHRVGHLEIGDLAVVVAVSAAHRGAALDGCRELIDALKARCRSGSTSCSATAPTSGSGCRDRHPRTDRPA